MVMSGSHKLGAINFKKGVIFMLRIVNSKGKSKSYINFIENLLIPPNTIIPPIEVISKVVKSNHLKDFDKKYHDKLIEDKGFYTDLQSINSEDAITWSLFGYISKLSDNIRIDFFNELLSKINLENDDYCDIKLWQRLPHPDTFVSGGPEIDVLLIGKKNFIIIECKWNANFSKNQGVDKKQDQMQIREKWINTIGKVIYPSHSFSLVYVGKERKKDSKYISITWNELSNFDSLPHKNEFLAYLESKK